MRDQLILDSNASSIPAMLQYIEKNKRDLNNWLNSDSNSAGIKAHEVLPIIVTYCFDALKNYHKYTVSIINNNEQREVQHQMALAEKFSVEEQNELLRTSEKNQMEKHDPMRNHPKFKEIGSHLAPLSKLEALAYVHDTFRSNNSDVTGRSVVPLKAKLVDSHLIKNSVVDYLHPLELVKALGSLQQAITTNFQTISSALDKKDSHFENIQHELVDQMVEKRKREEEVYYIFSKPV